MTLPQQPNTTAQAVYTTDPNMRLPVPQAQGPHAQQPQPQPQQQQHLMSAHAQHQATARVAGAGLGVGAGAAREAPTTDGLGLLIEAFDTHQTAVGPAPAPGAGGAPGSHPPPSPYGAHPPPPPHPQQQYYAQAGLPIDDGYENELGYYMSADGVGAPAMQAWAAGGGDMYGY